MVVARVAGQVSVENYRTRGGSRIARPITATSRTITTIDTVSIVFTPNAPIRRDAEGAYSSSRAWRWCERFRMKPFRAPGTRVARFPSRACEMKSASRILPCT